MGRVKDMAQERLDMAKRELVDAKDGVKRAEENIRRAEEAFDQAVVIDQRPDCTTVARRFGNAAAEQCRSKAVGFVMVSNVLKSREVPVCRAHAMLELTAQQKLNPSDHCSVVLMRD